MVVFTHTEVERKVRMDIEIKVNLDYPLSEVRETIASALKSATDMARFRRDQFRKLCQAFEKKYGFSSEEFLREFEGGTLGDEEAYFDWFAAKRGLDVWEKRYRILAESSL